MTRRNPPEFLDKYRPADIPGLPRYAQLRETLLAAIDDGHWEPGSRIPNEAALASMTPYSLGTVQKAMRDLAQRGVIVLRRGEGTFVATHDGELVASVRMTPITIGGRPALLLGPLVVAPRLHGRRGGRRPGRLARGDRDGVLAAAAEGLDALCVNPTTPVGEGDTTPTPTGAMVRGAVSGRFSASFRGAGLNLVYVRDVARGHVLAL